MPLKITCLLQLPMKPPFLAPSSVCRFNTVKKRTATPSSQDKTRASQTQKPRATGHSARVTSSGRVPQDSSHHPPLTPSSQQATVCACTRTLSPGDLHSLSPYSPEEVDEGAHTEARAPSTAMYASVASASAQIEARALSTSTARPAAHGL